MATKVSYFSRGKDRRLPRAAATVVEVMERRTLLSATFANGTLTVTGTSGNDNIRVDVSRNIDTDRAEDVKVTVNGVVQQFTAVPTGDKLIINALGGNDTIIGSGSQNIGESEDYLRTSIFGGDGNDVIQDDLGNVNGIDPGTVADSLDGGSGDDSLEIRNGGLSVLNGGDGNDSLQADETGLGEQQITMMGGNGNDTFSTTDVDDHATIYGGAGNDTYQISVFNSSDGNVIALNGEQNVGNLYFPGNDVENVTGEAAAFVHVIGNSLNNVISVSTEGGGAVTLDGGDGNDTLQSIGSNGFAATSFLNGGSGNDLLIGSPGIDHFNGGAGVDTVDYSARTANLKIYNDNSHASGDPSEPVFDYTTNTDLQGERDTLVSIDRILGGTGNDLIVGNNNSEALYGNDGNDSIFGSGGNDNLYGGNGNDLLDGGSGADKISGGAGSDVADYHTRTANLVVWLSGAHPSGQSGENDHFDGTVEQVYGGSGNDYLVGTTGNNALFGNGGNDTIFGGGGVDAFFGGAGNDQIHSKNGNKDYVDGGAGNDSAVTDPIDTVVNVETVTH